MSKLAKFMTWRWIPRRAMPWRGMITVGVARQHDRATEDDEYEYGYT